ncbi:MAG: hypothetical protein WD847_13435 [Pirellulales bacterium]
MTEQRRYRRHRITWLALLLVGAALAWCQAVGTVGDIDYLGTWRTKGYGWPLIYLVRHQATLALEPRPIDFSSASAVGNVVFNLLVLVCVFISFETLLRKPDSRFQLQISHLFAITTVIAIVVWLVVYEPGTWPYGITESGGARLRWHPWPVRVPILFGLGCTFYVAGWIIARAASRLCHAALRSKL